MEFRAVVGFEDYYEVSDAGQVRSLDRVVLHGKGGGERRLKGRMLKQNPDIWGYPLVNVYMDGEHLARGMS
jgi:hypothetical protein